LKFPEEEDYIFTLYNSVGQLIKEENIHGSELEIALDLKPAFYTCTIKTASGIISRKLIVE
jgi:hypothetical protein